MKKAVLIFLFLPLVTFAESIGHQTLYTYGTSSNRGAVYWGTLIGTVRTGAINNYGNFNLTNTVPKDQYYQIKYSSGFNLGVRVGYESDSWRYEGRIHFFNSNHKDIYLDQVVQPGEHKTMAYMGYFDLYYDFMDLRNYVATPFVGLGTGVVAIENRVSSDFINDKSSSSSSNKSSLSKIRVVPSYNFILGAALAASDYTTLEILYRDLVTAKTKGVELLQRPYRAHSIEFGLRFNF